MTALPRLLLGLALVQVPTVYVAEHQLGISKDVRLRGVSAISDTVAWVSGAKGTIARTTDGGKNWQLLTVPGAESLDFRDIDAIDATTAYALSIGPGEASRIFKTVDGGKTWTLQHTNRDPKAFFDAMTFSDAMHGVVMSDSVDGQFVIMLTSNGGKTWTRAPLAGLPPALPNEGAFAASGTNIAVVGSTHIWIGTGAASTARVLRSIDGGRTWKAFNTPLASGASSGIFSIAFRDTLHGVIVGGDYKKESEAVDNVAFTSDGGATWTLAREHGLSGFRSAVAYSPHAGSPTLVAVGPSGTDVSFDDGHSWHPRTDIAGLDTLSIAPKDGTAWGSGNKGMIRRIGKILPPK